jgi:hypothetical protein
MSHPDCFTLVRSDVTFANVRKASGVEGCGIELKLYYLNREVDYKVVSR